VSRLRDAGARWLVVEKILGEHEVLPVWLGADGTTGYEFADRAGGVLVDEDAEAPLTALWRGVAGDDRSFGEIALEARAQAAAELFPADGIGREQTRAAVISLLGGLDVYRTYVAGDGVPGDGLADAPDGARIAAA